jgi:hypothetical protein
MLNDTKFRQSCPSDQIVAHFIQHLNTRKILKLFFYLLVPLVSTANASDDFNVCKLRGQPFSRELARITEHLDSWVFMSLRESPAEPCIHIQSSANPDGQVWKCGNNLFMGSFNLYPPKIWAIDKNGEQFSIDWLNQSSTHDCEYLGGNFFKYTRWESQTGRIHAAPEIPVFFLIKYNIMLRYSPPSF